MWPVLLQRNIGNCRNHHINLQVMILLLGSDDFTRQNSLARFCFGLREGNKKNSSALSHMSTRKPLTMPNFYFSPFVFAIFF